MRFATTLTKGTPTAWRTFWNREKQSPVKRRRGQSATSTNRRGTSKGWLSSLGRATSGFGASWKVEGHYRSRPKSATPRSLHAYLCWFVFARRGTARHLARYRAAGAAGGSHQ